MKIRQAMLLGLGILLFFVVCDLCSSATPPVAQTDNLDEGAHNQRAGVGVDIADMNGDGHLDIVSVSPNGVKYFESDGNGGYFDRGVVIAETGTFLNCAGVDIAIADLDNNGVPDIVIAGPNGIRIFKNPIPQ